MWKRFSIIWLKNRNKLLTAVKTIEQYDALPVYHTTQWESCFVMITAAAFTHGRSTPCRPHVHLECVCFDLQQRSFATQLQVEVGGVRSEAEILSEVHRQNYLLD